jgi:hypothetical protein
MKSLKALFYVIWRSDGEEENDCIDLNKKRLEVII